jgi:hypothetical protein
LNQPEHDATIYHHFKETPFFGSASVSGNPTSRKLAAGVVLED